MRQTKQQENLEEKIHVVISFFYNDLFKDIYLKEINKNVDGNELLPILDEGLLEEVALIYSMSYFLEPIITSYRGNPQYEELIEEISNITGMSEELFSSRSRKAAEYLSSGPLGAYKFYWSIFNQVANNKIPIPKNPFPATIFTLIATQLMEYGINGLKALEINER